MKLVYRVIFIAVIAFSAASQLSAQYGNEWIKPNQVYYKFGVAANQIFRLSDSVLKAVGIPANVEGQHFQLYRNGEEVAIYTSTNGVFANNDYIEFFAYRANADKEAKLYNIEATPNPYASCFSDTAIYFLSYNLSTTNNLRYVPTQNLISNPPAKETYCLDTILRYNRSDITFMHGLNYNPGTDYISSLYDLAEGFSYRRVTNGNDSALAITLADAYKAADAPSINLQTSLCSESEVSHKLIFGFAGNILLDTSFNGYRTIRLNKNISASSLPTNNVARVRINPYSTATPDRVSITHLYLKYARGFNFGASNKLQEFYLGPKSGQYYVEVNSFNDSGQAPVLYDMTSKKRYLGDKTVAGKIRFQIAADNSEHFFVMANAKVFTPINNLQAVSFVDFAAPAAQGDYLIVSHPSYYFDNNNNNAMDDYRQYRSSTAGGGFNAKVVNVEDLYNSFGYGQNFSVAAIRSFMEYINANWTTKPKYVFYVGKGVNYKDLIAYQNTVKNTPGAYPYIPTPTYGHPGADLFFADFNYDRESDFAYGRLSVFNGTELRAYLNKVIEYEQSLDISNKPFQEILWKKKSLHIAGANNLTDQVPIVASLNSAATIIKGVNYGSENRLIRKESTNIVDIVNIASIDSMLNQGLGLIQFFGHSSSKGFDYGLDEPSKYENVGKYNFFIANGCNAGTMFVPFGTKTITEKFVAEPNKGSICFIASAAEGLVTFLATYTKQLYSEIAKCDGRSIGTMMKNTHAFFKNKDIFSRLYNEFIMANGDPAVPFANYTKPDYVVDKQYVAISPSTITTMDDSFSVNVIVFNAAQFKKDSLTVRVNYQMPNSLPAEVYFKAYPSGISFADTFNFKLAVNKLAGGFNSLQIEIDPENLIDEINESNNRVQLDFYIYDNQLIPVYPKNYAIVNSNSVELRAYTSNLFAPELKYVLQIDTSKKFNSALLQSTNLNSKGGVIQWRPNLILQDSVVYYWRCAYDTIVNNALAWNYSSFVYLPQEGRGWNQSHFYQYAEDNAVNLTIDSAIRNISFIGANRKFGASICMYNMPAPYNYSWADFNTDLNDINLYTYTAAASLSNTFQFVLLDEVSGLPVRNDTVQGGGGRYGSITPRPQDGRADFFEFPFKTALQRKTIMDFLDSIPNNYYVALMPFLYNHPTAAYTNKVFVDSMMNDTLLYGSGQSIYHKLKNLGFTEIDSFYRNNPFFFFYQKANPLFVPVQEISTNPNQILNVQASFSIPSVSGYISSKPIGAAKNWAHFYREYSSPDGGLGDTTYVDIFGIDSANNEQMLARVYGKDTALNFIDAQAYPYLKLKLYVSDNINATPTKEKYWRVLFDPLPEFVLCPNELLQIKDTFVQGENYKIQVGVRNVSDVDADSVLMYYRITDQSNNDTPLPLVKIAPIKADSFAAAVADLNTLPFEGLNKFYVEANYQKQQREEVYDNNFGIFPFFVTKDYKNPLLDVTFDGVHIMYKDLVSASPFIKIKLIDENKFLNLSDTNAFVVGLGVPVDEKTSIFDSFQIVKVDNDTLKFFPASSNSKNEAYLEYRPHFAKSGIYKLSVSAKDRTGNFATKDYTITFEVDTTKAVTQLLNYPNPFSTSTQFIFTLSGSYVPDNVRIRIFSVTGKLVREISKSELGNIHVGRNVSDYRWDGTDQYGQKLANGVYFYQFIVTDKNEKLDKYTKGLNNVDLDSYFKHNIGKLYILR